LVEREGQAEESRNKQPGCVEGHPSHIEADFFTEVVLRSSDLHEMVLASLSQQLSGYSERHEDESLVRVRLKPSLLQFSEVVGVVHQDDLDEPLAAFKTRNVEDALQHGQNDFLFVLRPKRLELVSEFLFERHL